MTQPAVYCALYLLGVAFQLGFGPRRQPALCCALGFLTGLGLWVVLALAILVSPLGYSETTAIAMYIAPMGACAVAAALRWRPGRRELIIVAAWTAASCLYFYWLSTFDAARFSRDSKHIVNAALRMPSSAHGSYITDKGSFLLIAHSLAQYTPEDYFYALAPAIGATAAPLFVLFGWRGLALVRADRPLTRALMVVAALATFSTYNYLWHSIYIHTNLGTAVYLFALAGMIWLAELDRDAAYLPSVFLFLAAYALHRPEGPLFALVIVLVGLLPSRLPRPPLTIGLALYVIACALYLWWLPDKSMDKLTADRAFLMASLNIATFVVWLVGSHTRWIALARHLPRLLVAAMVLALVLGYFRSHAQFVKSAHSLYRNLLEQHHHMWGYAWHVVIALSLLSLTVPPVPSGRVLSYGALLSLLLVQLIGLAHPWRYGPTDSGNRMMLQVLPLAMFYFSMQFIPLLYGTRPAVVQDNPVPVHEDPETESRAAGGE